MRFNQFVIGCVGVFIALTNLRAIAVASSLVKGSLNSFSDMAMNLLIASLLNCI